MKIEDDKLDAVIQAYVLGRLSDAKASEFEEFFLSNPDLIEQVEIMQHMHAGLQQAESQVTERKSNISNHVTNRDTDRSLFERLRGLVSFPVPAFAVAAMAAILLPMTLENHRSDLIDSNISLINFSTQTTRSNNNGVVIDLSDGTQNRAIIIKLKTVDFANYRVKLTPINEDIAAWESTSFQVSALRDKLIVLPNLSISEANIEVYGIDHESNHVKVDFCHYSENCL